MFILMDINAWTSLISGTKKKSVAYTEKMKRLVFRVWYQKEILGPSCCHDRPGLPYEIEDKACLWVGCDNRRASISYESLNQWAIPHMTNKRENINRLDIQCMKLLKMAPP